MTIPRRVYRVIDCKLKFSAIFKGGDSPGINARYNVVISPRISEAWEAMGQAGLRGEARHFGGGLPRVESVEGQSFKICQKKWYRESHMQEKG